MDISGYSDENATLSLMYACLVVWFNVKLLPCSRTQPTGKLSEERVWYCDQLFMHYSQILHQHDHNFSYWLKWNPVTLNTSLTKNSCKHIQYGIVITNVKTCTQLPSIQLSTTAASPLAMLQSCVFKFILLREIVLYSTYKGNKERTRSWNYRFEK